MRDLDKRPYSDDERRVAEWLVHKTGIGAGDDPIGFTIVSHECLAAERKHIKDVLRRFRDYVSSHAVQWDNGSAQHHQPIWAEVAEVIGE